MRGRTVHQAAPVVRPRTTVGLSVLACILGIGLITGGTWAALLTYNGSVWLWAFAGFVVVGWGLYLGTQSSDDSQSA